MGESWGDAEIRQHALSALLEETQHLHVGPCRHDLMHGDLVIGLHLALVSDPGNFLKQQQDWQQIFN